MKVKNLIKKLQQFDPELDALVDREGRCGISDVMNEMYYYDNGLDAPEVLHISTLKDCDISVNDAEKVVLID